MVWQTDYWLVRFGTHAGHLPSGLIARAVCRVWVATLAMFLLADSAPAAFPAQPIKIIVYTQPGGPIDLTARHFAETAGNYTDATFVVENISGAGGLIAMEHVVGLQPDGYSLLACTKSNIAKAVVTDREDLLDALDWIGLLLIDPECVITRRDSLLADWQLLIDHARAHPGQQIWLGPGSGTMDHLMAIRIWDAFGTSGRWIPYNGGGRAIAALLGGQGIAYVGNPGDAAGQPDLRVSIVSGPSRLLQLPDTPTFGEMGHPELDQQFMWRGFALRSGCSPEVRGWYDRLFQQVTQNAQWRELWAPDGMQVVCLSEPDFPELVAETREEFRRYLPRLHVAPIEGGPLVQALSHGGTLTAVVLANLVIALVVRLRGTAGSWQQRLIPLAVLGMCVPILAQTWQFPPAWEGVGAAAVPRLWLTLTGLCALLAVLAPGQPTVGAAPDRSIQLVMKLAAVTALQWGVTVWVGYYPSALVGTWATLLLLGERRWSVLVGVSGGWLVCAYYLFHRLLHVDLPRGTLFS